MEFNFDELCLESFQNIKQALISAPIMQPPYLSIPFYIMCDTIDYLVSVVLEGQRKDKNMHREGTVDHCLCH